MILRLSASASYMFLISFRMAVFSASSNSCSPLEIMTIPVENRIVRNSRNSDSVVITVDIDNFSELTYFRPWLRLYLKYCPLLISRLDNFSANLFVCPTTVEKFFLNVFLLCIFTSVFFMMCRRIRRIPQLVRLYEVAE